MFAVCPFAAPRDPDVRRDSDRNRPHLLLLAHSTLPRSCESFADPHPEEPCAARRLEGCPQPLWPGAILRDGTTRLLRMRSSNRFTTTQVTPRRYVRAPRGLARNSADRTRKVGRRPLGTDHAKVINVPNPRAADLQRSVKQKSERAVQGGGIGEMARWSRRMPRRAIGGGTGDPSSSRNHLEPAVCEPAACETNRTGGGRRAHARSTALSYLVRGTTCI